MIGCHLLLSLFLQMHGLFIILISSSQPHFQSYFFHISDTFTQTKMTHLHKCFSNSSIKKSCSLTTQFPSVNKTNANQSAFIWTDFLDHENHEKQIQFFFYHEAPNSYHKLFCQFIVDKLLPTTMMGCTHCLSTGHHRASRQQLVNLLKDLLQLRAWTHIADLIHTSHTHHCVLLAGVTLSHLM